MTHVIDGVMILGGRCDETGRTRRIGETEFRGQSPSWTAGASGWRFSDHRTRSGWRSL